MNSRLFLALACLALGACTHVAPYQREHLAKPSMDLAHEGGEISFGAHVFEAREGAAGGHGLAGGGCGCN